MKCRSCKNKLKLCFIDLGNAPPSNSYLSKKQLNSTEMYYPLQVFICDSCWLAQVIDYAGRDIFFNEFYPYFSSVSKSFTIHSKNYVDYVIKRFNLKSNNSKIVEIASNDGYLLQFFKKKKFKCLGIEPSTSCAKTARKKKINVIEKFFDFDLAKKLAKKNTVDLIVANNVLAHVPDINNFARGISILLKKKGVVTFEFPHLLELIKNNQYDTIYHEHYSYLSLIAVNTIFEKNGLKIFDVQQIGTHGGSLRVFAQKKNYHYFRLEKNVSKIISLEKKYELNSIKPYKNFQKTAEKNKNELLDFLIKCKNKNLKVAAFGAAAKGNTLLNYAGIKKDLISFVCDSSKSKQNRFLPGSRIPIYSPNYLTKNKPDYLLILAWNIADEIKDQLKKLNKKTKFFVAIPKVKII